MVKRKSRRNSKNYRKTKRVSRKMRTNKRINRNSNKRMKRRTNKRIKRRTNQRINGKSNKRMKRRTNQRMKRRTNQRMKRRRMGERTTYYKVGGGDVLSSTQEELRSKIGTTSTLLDFLEKEIKETIGDWAFTDDKGGVHYDALKSAKLIDREGVRRKIYGKSVYKASMTELLMEDRELFNIVLERRGTVKSLNDVQFMKFAKFYSDFILKLQGLVNEFTLNQTAQYDEFWEKANRVPKKDDHVIWISDTFTILKSDLKEKPPPSSGAVRLKKNMKGIVTRTIQTDDGYDVQVVFKDIQRYIKNPIGVVCETHDIKVIDFDPSLEIQSASILAAANEALEAEKKRQKGLTFAEEGRAGMERISPTPPSLPPPTGRTMTRRRKITVPEAEEGSLLPLTTPSSEKEKEYDYENFKRMTLQEQYEEIKRINEGGENFDEKVLHSEAESHLPTAREFLGDFDFSQMQSIVDMCFALTSYAVFPGFDRVNEINEAQNKVEELHQVFTTLKDDMGSSKDYMKKWEFLNDVKTFQTNVDNFKNNTCRNCNMKSTPENMMSSARDASVFKCQHERCPVFWDIEFNAAGLSHDHKNACDFHRIHIEGVIDTNGGGDMISHAFWSVEGFNDWVDTKKGREKLRETDIGVPRWDGLSPSGSGRISKTRKKYAADFHRWHMIRLFELKSSTDGDVDLFVLLQAAYNKLIYILEADGKGGLHVEMHGSDATALRMQKKDFRDQATVMLKMNVSEIMGVSGGVDETLNSRLLREPDVPGTKYNLKDLPSLFVGIMLNAFNHEDSDLLFNSETGLITTHDRSGQPTRAKIKFGLSGNKITITDFERE